MSALYLFRHAQAGPRQRYDNLSELGQAQARALGRHLVSQQARFSAVFTGSLERQKLTASAVEQVYRDAGVDFPAIIEDPLWDEFDLGAVYTAIADHLSRDDPEFKREYEDMMRLIEDENHGIHRKHTYCDTAVVRAWTDDRYPYDGESWSTFRSRILSRVERLSSYNSGQKIAVFTSAAPIAIWMGQALKLEHREVWRIAGATYNSGITTFQLRDQNLRLFSFNSLPHLPDPGLWSFR